MDDFAIVVGVRFYPGLRNLEGPENDANAFYGWLVEPAGGGLPMANVKKVVSSDFSPPTDPGSAKPTVEAIQTAFDWLDGISQANMAAMRGPQVGRRLYLYFSGHGFAPAFDTAAILMANATERKLGYHVAGRLWADWFYKNGYFQEIALLMDCCRSNYSLVPLQPVTYNDTVYQTGLNGRKRFYAFGTKWGGKSWERVRPEDGLAHGVFTTALLTGLRGRAADPASGAVTSSLLKSYLINNMRTFMAPEDLATPGMDGEPEVNPADEILFATVTAPASANLKVVVSVAARHVGKRAVVLGSQLETLRQADNIPAVWGLTLPMGLYSAQVGDQPELLFRVQPSQEVTNVYIP